MQAVKLEMIEENCTTLQNNTNCIKLSLLLSKLTHTHPHTHTHTVRVQ